MKTDTRTHAPVHLLSCVPVNAVPAFPGKVRGGEERGVHLQAGEDQQEGRPGVPGGGQTREQRQRPCLPPCASGSHGFRTDAPGQLRSAPGRGVRWDLCCSGGLCEETCCHPLPAADCRAGCAADTLSDHSMAQRTAAGFCPELCPPPSAGQVMRNPTAPKGCSLWNTRTPPPSQHSASSCPFLDQHLSNANSTRRSTTSTMSHCRMI